MTDRMTVWNYSREHDAFPTSAIAAWPYRCEIHFVTEKNRLYADFTCENLRNLAAKKTKINRIISTS